VARNATILYSNAVVPAVPFNDSGVARQVLSDIACVYKKRLASLAMFSLLLGVPTALVFSALVFLMERVQPGLAEPARMMSLLLLGKTVLSAFVLGGVRRALSRAPKAELKLAAMGFTVLITGGAATALAPTLPLLLPSVVYLGLSGFFFIPWLRTLRQELLLENVEEHARAGVTGVLISVEACSYLVSAALMSLFAKDLSLAVWAATALATVGVALAWRIAIALHRNS
jgi:MFS family permease